MKLSHSLLFAACCLAAAGCSSTSDTGTDGGTDGGGDTHVTTDTGTGDSPTDTPTDSGVGCGTCATTNCKDKVNACAADTLCKKDIDCLNACLGSKTCDNACITNECGADGGTSCPPSDTLFNDLITCLQASCSDSCFGKP